MTNEEIQRLLEFVIKQQESFADNMTKAEERMTRMETASVGLFSIVSESVKVQKELVERQKELMEAQKQPDERLNTLLAAGERYFRNGRNGGARS